jgi:regulator of protease activity HflC (stomatin/prohibitin superfamily)
MIWISIVIGILGLGALIVSANASLRSGRIFGFAAVVVAVVFLALSFFTIVPAGHVGVSVILGSVSSQALPQGLRIKHPFANIITYSTRVQTYTMASTADAGDTVSALSKDGMRMPLDVTIAYRLNGDDAPWLYEHIGVDYRSKIIRTAARTSVREALSKYTSQEAYASKRAQLASAMERLLKKRLKGLLEQEGYEGQAIQIEQVMLRNVDLPPRVKAAIEDKLAAEQESLKMTFVLERERQEADRKRIEAEGIKSFQDIVRQGIDKQLLQWKGIEATRELAASENSKIVIIGGSDGLPIILNTDSK